MYSETEKQEVLSLIEEVRSADFDKRQTAFETLLARYEPLILALVQRYSEDPLSERFREDMRQEATVAFYHSILAYDTDQTDVEFGLYAKICISNALVSQVRKFKRRAIEPLADTERDDFFLHDFEDPSESILEQERAEALCLVIRNNLSTFEYRVWQYYISGRTAREIAAMTNKDEKSISNAIYRIRKKLRAVLQ